jgi:hypothetical protein
MIEQNDNCFRSPVNWSQKKRMRARSDVFGWLVLVVVVFLFFVVPPLLLLLLLGAGLQDKSTRRE